MRSEKKLLIGLTVFLFVASPVSSLADGNISGTVFHDYNGNGVQDLSSVTPNFGTGSISNAIDTGVAGVSVSAFDRSGSVVTTTSQSNGNYVLDTNPLGDGPYRIEISNYPAGFTNSALSSSGVGNQSSVRFISGAPSSQVDFGILASEDFCENAPEILTSRYLTGGANGSGAPVLVSFPFSSGSDGATPPPYDLPTTPSLAIPAEKVGTTWGLAYQRSTKTGFAASFMKKHTAFGPGADAVFNNSDDAGAIYRFDLAGNVLGAFTVPGATTNPHNTSDYFRDNFDIAWNGVGKSSLGGIALSPDEGTVFVMNLQNRRLYSLNAFTGATIASVGVPLNLPSCPAEGDVRPFAVSTHRGIGYIGLVCSAESTQDVNDLRGYIYTFDLTTLSISASPVFTFPLNYPRGLIANGSIPISASWRPWVSVYTALPVNQTFVGYPQPWLTDITFDQDNLILGIRDRFGDQAGYKLPSDPSRPTTNIEGVTAGDTLRACGSPSTGWILESNGRCVGLGSSPQNSGQGPGNGEFYVGDNWRSPSEDYHQETTLGGLLQIPGFPDVITSVFNPVPITLETYDGGTRWMSNVTGRFTKGYRIFNLTPPLTSSTFFGKASGIGDLHALCSEAPLEIGNRVWLDTNGNGIQDPGESPLGGVEVQLFDSSQTLLSTAITEADGTYLFSSDGGSSSGSRRYNLLGLTPNTGGFELRVSLAQGVLTSLFPSLPNVTSGMDGDLRDSDGIVSGPVVKVSFSTGGAGTNDHSFDFGFTSSPPPVNPTPMATPDPNRPVCTTDLRSQLVILDSRALAIFKQVREAARYRDFLASKVSCGRISSKARKSLLDSSRAVYNKIWSQLWTNLAVKTETLCNGTLDSRCVSTNNVGTLQEISSSGSVLYGNGVKLIGSSSCGSRNKAVRSRRSRVTKKLKEALTGFTKDLQSYPTSTQTCS